MKQKQPHKFCGCCPFIWGEMRYRRALRREEKMSISNPTIAEVNIFGGNFAPRGWAFCNGQLLAIAQYQSLFSIVGTMYGGDGRTTFALPDLRGRSALHEGTGPGLPQRRQGSSGGNPTRRLNSAELPPHNHTASLHGELASADRVSPQDSLLAVTSATTQVYAAPVAAENRTMSQESISMDNAGSSADFSVMNPYCVVQYIIALEGMYPSRS